MQIDGDEMDDSESGGSVGPRPTSVLPGHGGTSKYPQALLDQVAKELGLYVYLLVDPRDNLPFYVGKGRGLRFAAHGLEAAANDSASEREVSRKLQQINEICADGQEPVTWILRYGLNERDYTEVEAAAIDLLMSFPLLSEASDRRQPLQRESQLTNERRERAHGHGIRALEGLIEELGAPTLNTTTPLLLTTLGGWTDLPETIAGGARRDGAGYKSEWLISSERVRAFDDIAKSVTAWWRIDPQMVQKRGIRHVVAVHRGVTRGLYEIVPDSWETQPLVNLATGGRQQIKRAFRVEAVTEGKLFDSVIGPFGHRVNARAKGSQNSIFYWPR